MNYLPTHRTRTHQLICVNIKKANKTTKGRKGRKEGKKKKLPSHTDRHTGVHGMAWHKHPPTHPSFPSHYSFIHAKHCPLVMLTFVFVEVRCLFIIFFRSSCLCHTFALICPALLVPLPWIALLLFRFLPSHTHRAKKLNFEQKH
jgi:hypothetical protein